MTNRRSFIKSITGLAGTSLAFAAGIKGRVKITDIQTMMMQGPRTYTLVKVLTDAGVFGIGEAYGSPGAGVRDQVLTLKQELLGKDPTEIDVVYTGLGQRIDGSAHSLMRGISGIEMALWDVTGKLLNTPATKLLGGKFRDK